VDPVPDPLLFFLVVPGIEPGPRDPTELLVLVIRTAPLQTAHRLYINAGSLVGGEKLVHGAFP
jgi:hypothetical protein